MTERPISRAILVAVGLLMSFSAAAWLLSLPVGRLEILARIGWVSAIFCALGVLTFSFAVVLASVARRRKWSPRTCHRAGLLILPVVLSLCFFASPQVRSASASLIILPAIFAGILCRKLTYPQLSEDEAYAPEPPLSLFRR